MQILCLGRATCCPGLCPNGFWIFPRMETPHPPQATCGRAQSPSRWKTISGHLEEPSGLQFVPMASGPVTNTQGLSLLLTAKSFVKLHLWKCPLIPAWLLCMFFFRKKTIPKLLWEWKLRKAWLQNEERIKITPCPRRKDICNKTVLSKSLNSKMCRWLNKCMMWWLNPILDSAVSVWWVSPAGQLNTTQLLAHFSLPVGWAMEPEGQRENSWVEIKTV